MTEGRFETVHNLRPKNWDHRRHWTNWHHLYDCEDDHLARESCPFHDLRAGGQFQYENWGGGPYAVPIEPQRLNERPCGDGLDFAKGRGTNMGGWGDIPLDTEPGRPVAALPPRFRTVFTKKDPLRRGLFSEFPYMPDGSQDGDASGLRGGEEDGGAGRLPRLRAGGMKAGGPARYLGIPPEYIHDPYRDKIDRGRISHFRTGPIRHNDPPYIPHGPEVKTKRKTYGPFLAGKPNDFTVGGDPEWIPDPYDKGAIRHDRRPFRTWHTRTKQSMPTHAPWTTGLASAEPHKGPALDLTEVTLPNLKSSGVMSLRQTIGPEAALSSTS